MRWVILRCLGFPSQILTDVLMFMRVQKSLAKDIFATLFSGATIDDGGKSDNTVII